MPALARPLSVLAIVVATVHAEEVRFLPEQLLGRGVSDDVVPTADGTALELEAGELIADDGPAAGFSYRPNEEPLDGRTIALKELVVADRRTRKATLLVAPGGALVTAINGQAAELVPDGRAGQYWQQYRVDPALLRAGVNTIAMSGTGRLWIARDDEFAAGAPAGRAPPNRSRRSVDGGRSWSDTRLGREGNVDGEYYVRLFLDQFRDRGRVELPVLDSASLAGESVAGPGPPAVLTAHVDGDTPESTEITVAVRSGDTLRVDGERWSEWSVVSPAAERLPLHGRFFQISLTLSTANRLVSPRVRCVTIRSAVDPGQGWCERVRGRGRDASAVVRSAIPFEYEPLDHPRLAEFRRRFQLDEVVRGAHGEWDTVCRLAAWSATRWQGSGHLGEGYPAWDAIEILSLHADGSPVGGFCQQANVVFLQACLSLGIQGRPISLGPGGYGDRIRGGHETVEIWSNAHRTWAYVDGSTAWYAVDAAGDTPLSLRQLRHRQLRALRGEPSNPIKVVSLAATPRTWNDVTGWPPLVELRMIPRNNFLERQGPLPLNQGMRGWFWTGHHVWTDGIAPAASLYGQRVPQVANWDWTLNEVSYHCQALEQPGTLRVHLDTVTPGFSHYLVEQDAGRSEVRQQSFIWRLQQGMNEARVRAVNVLGRAGHPQTISLEYRP